jgi:hypothetical protein
MIDIEEEDIEEETLEDRIFEKADYIGDILTGERKVKVKLPDKNQKNLPHQRPKYSQFQLFINDFKKSLLKYKHMSLSRVIGMSIILILAISIMAIVGYLLFLLLTSLLKFGIAGLVGFTIFMCAVSGSVVLFVASRFTTK